MGGGDQVESVQTEQLLLHPELLLLLLRGGRGQQAVDTEPGPAGRLGGWRGGGGGRGHGEWVRSWERWERKRREWWGGDGRDNRESGSGQGG